jgi:hypothetical protein
MLNVWEFGQENQPEHAGRLAQNRLRPQLAGRIVETEGDVLRFQVTRGRISDPGGLFYVERHGLFRVDHRDVRNRGSVLTLRAWPSV